MSCDEARGHTVESSSRQWGPVRHSIAAQDPAQISFAALFHTVLMFADNLNLKSDRVVIRVLTGRVQDYIKVG